MALRQLLMQCAGALSRRRAYAATHPMVLAAEQQLFDTVSSLLQSRPQLVLGVAKTDLLIDGEPYITTGSFAHDLAVRLHRRNVGALTFAAGLALPELRDALAWLASEPGDDDCPPPQRHALRIALVAYDQLIFGSSEQADEETGSRLWQSLAQFAGESGFAPSAAGTPDTSAHGDDGLAQHLRDAMQQSPDIARRTATALQEYATEAASTSGATRRTMGEQLDGALARLGTSSFAPIIRSLGDRSLQHRFVSRMVSAVPAATVVDWIHAAAQSREQQMSHHLIRLMSKLSVYAEANDTPIADSVFRCAAHDLVRNWMLPDPNPEEHVALLDRIALHERSLADAIPFLFDGRAADVESARLVQMALEIDVVGDDALAAADALISSSHCVEILGWVNTTGDTQSARALRAVVVSDAAVRTFLLTEPVDRLEARALLDQLDAASVEALIDVLAASEVRGTRLLVRQRLAEFGATILPTLLARLDAAPWFLVRNILTLLHEIAVDSNGANAALENMVDLMEHSQVQVRIEAFRLLLLDSQAREAAIRRALHDKHERVVILALQALADAGDTAPQLSADVITQLLTMVDTEAHSEPLRAHVVRALALTPDARVREWLVTHATKRSHVLRRLQLATPTPVAIAALNALRRSHESDPTVQRILAMVRESGVERQWKSREPTVAHEVLT